MNFAIECIPLIRLLRHLCFKITVCKQMLEVRSQLTVYKSYPSTIISNLPLNIENLLKNERLSLACVLL